MLQPALFCGGIRGLAATKHLPAGSEVVRVPQAALISHETAKSSELVRSSPTTVNMFHCKQQAAVPLQHIMAGAKLVQAPGPKTAHAYTIFAT